MTKVENSETCMEILSMLENLSNGWRQTKSINHNFQCEYSSLLLEIYKVTEHLYLVWNVDVLYEASHYIQILKIWEISALSNLPKLEQKLDNIFKRYSKDKINCCKFTNHEG